MGLTPEEQYRKDVSYSPASESETEAKQEREEPAVRDPAIDKRAVLVAPGTGGPDDSGDVDVDGDELDLPFRKED